jgi:sulfite exporter TauE/SafE
MAGVIGPIVYGAHRTKKWFIILVLHALGYVCGALIIGLILGVVGKMVIPFQVTSALGLILTGVTCLVFCARELRFLSFRPPHFRRQVPHGWRRFRPEIMAPLYGGVLGMGVLTRIEATSFYPVLVWALLSRSATMGAVVMGGFGLGRALPYLLLTRLESVEECTSVAHAVQRHQAILATFNGIVLGFIGGSLLVLGVSTS